MSVAIDVLTPEQIADARRAELERAGLSLEELEAREARFELDAEKRAVLRRLRLLDFIDE